MQSPSPAPRDLDLAPPLVPRPGFSVTPPAAALPGFDASQSPLSPGGRPGAPAPLTVGGTSSPEGLRARLIGLTLPHRAGSPRVIYRVRREGWVARRAAARSRFASITEAQGPSTPRILRHLVERGARGILGRTTHQRATPRFELRRCR